MEQPGTRDQQGENTRTASCTGIGPLLLALPRARLQVSSSPACTCLPALPAPAASPTKPLSCPGQSLGQQQPAPSTTLPTRRDKATGAQPPSLPGGAVHTPNGAGGDGTGPKSLCCDAWEPRSHPAPGSVTTDRCARPPRTASSSAPHAARQCCTHAAWPSAGPGQGGSFCLTAAFPSKCCSLMAPDTSPKSPSRQSQRHAEVCRSTQESGRGSICFPSVHKRYRPCSST